MAIVAVVGDACTTTTVALASALAELGETRSSSRPTRRGGDLAAWFDLPVAPSLSTVVTARSTARWSEIDRHTRLAPSGLRLIPAPPTPPRAQQAVAESARAWSPRWRRRGRRVAVVDAGGVAHPPAVTSVRRRRRGDGARPSPVAAVGARRRGAVAAARRPDRGCDLELVGGARRRRRRRGIRSTSTQIESFLADSRRFDAPVVGLPVDDLTAAVLRRSHRCVARRLARLPLARAAARPRRTSSTRAARVIASVRCRGRPDDARRLRVHATDHASARPVRDRSRRRPTRRGDRARRDRRRPTTRQRTSAVAPLAADARRQQLLVGAWLSDEIALVNQDRMRRGESPLTCGGRSRGPRSCASPSSPAPGRSSRSCPIRSSRRSTSTRTCRRG